MDSSNHNNMHYLHSSQIAKQRLRAMQQKDKKEDKVNLPNLSSVEANDRLTNNYPPDNNPSWDGNHNPLSSKGD